MTRRVVLSDEEWACIEARLATAEPPRVEDSGVHDAVTGLELSADAVV